MVNMDLVKIVERLEAANFIYDVYETDTRISFKVNDKGNDSITLYIANKFKSLGYDVNYSTYESSIRVDEVDYKKEIDSIFTEV